MTPLRILSTLVLAFVLVPAARAVEPWADPKLPVKDGLELWLDAGRIDATSKAAKEKLPVGGKLAAWFDGSGKGRHVRQAAEGARPTVMKVGDAAVVRFDGEDDHFRITG
ncbi:MAG TPA: hypothetical protein VM529_04555, partial [Gemmata sp.]|nr:hypothetical protein [Gemmata sp.]